MTENNIHFEQVWEQAEKLALELYKTDTSSDILISITNLLNQYKELEASDVPNEVKTSLKNRYLGEIIFLLTAISARDDINVYAALQDEIKLNQ